MNKQFKLIFFFCLIVLTLSTLSADEVRVGGYHRQPSVPNDDDFQAADAYAREKYPEELADATIISVSTQTVSGINYKIQYQTARQEQYQVVVYNQPWTQTINLLSFQKLTPQEQIL